MLNRSIIASATDTAFEIKNNLRLSLDVAQNSILGQLVSSSEHPLDLNRENVSFNGQETVNLINALRPTPVQGFGVMTPECFASQIEYVTADSDLHQSDHTNQVIAAADNIGLEVSSHVAMFRTVVLPRVLEMVEAMEHFIAEAKPVSPTLAFNLVKGKVPELILDDAIQGGGLANYVSSSEPNHISVQHRVAPFTGEGSGEKNFVTNWLTFPNERLNQLYRDWVASLPPYFIDSVFHRYFSGNTDSFSWVWEDHWWNACNNNGKFGQFNNLNLGLAGYLIAQKLLESPPSGADTSVSLVDMRASLASARDEFGALAMSSLRRYHQQVQNGILVSEMNTEEKTIIVNDVVYGPWLEAGNRPEQLFGMMVSGDIQFSGKVITENAHRYLKSWESFHAIHMASETARYNNLFRNFIVNYVLLGLTEEKLSDIEKEFRSTNPNFTTVVAAMVEKTVHGGSEWDKDLHATARRLVAGCRFFFTAAEQYLADFHEAGLANPDLEPDEAAFIALAKYVTRFTVAQITTKPA